MNRIGPECQSLHGKKNTSQRGFSLIELMIAMVVLAIGLLGGIAFIAAATASNSRARLNTAAATLAESTMERIVAIPQSATGASATTTLTDCAGHSFTINTARGGSVDFSRLSIPEYSMRYVTCPSGIGVTYDIRWKIERGPTPSTQLVTVSARSLSGSTAPAAKLVRPFTLRQLRGDY